MIRGILPPMPQRDRTINYLEVTVPDLAAAKRFFGEVFGWTFTDYGPTYASFAAAEAGLDGGFEEGEVPPGRGPFLPVLYASDLEATQARISAGGGVVTQSIFSFPGGRRFHFADPGGNEWAVWSE